MVNDTLYRGRPANPSTWSAVDRQAAASKQTEEPGHRAALFSYLRFLAGAGPAAGLAFEDEGIEEVFGGFLFLGPELRNGGEPEPQLVVGSARALLEDEPVGGDAERPGEAFQGTHGGLGRPFFVAVDLGLIEAYLGGQVFLCQGAGFAEAGEPLGKGHEVDPID